MGAVREEALASAGVRADGAIGIDAAPRALLEGLLDAVVGGRAPEPGAPRSGCRGRSLDACVGRAVFANIVFDTSLSRFSTLRSRPR